MNDQVQQAANVMEKGGASVAFGSWISSWFVTGVAFMDAHAQGVLAACGVIGAFVGLVGMVMKAWYTREADKRLTAEHHERLRLMRSGKHVSD